LRADKEVALLALRSKGMRRGEHQSVLAYLDAALHDDPEVVAAAATPRKVVAPARWHTGVAAAALASQPCGR
ncbi:unnamed protein product, partial [Polarella glacialis]